MSLSVKLFGKPRNIFLEEHFPHQIIDRVRVRSGIFLPNVQNRFNANADFGRKLCPNYVTMRLSQWADIPKPQSFPMEIMLRFYLVNWPDRDIQRYSWQAGISHDVTAKRKHGSFSCDLPIFDQRREETNPTRSNMWRIHSPLSRILTYIFFRSKMWILACKGVILRIRQTRYSLFRSQVGSFLCFGSSQVGSSPTATGFAFVAGH